MKKKNVTILLCLFLLTLMSITVNGQDEAIKKTVEYEVKKENHADGSSQNHVMTITKDGEKKVYTWDGEGEMPEEMKEQMEDVIILEDHEGEVKTIVIDRDDRRGDRRAHRNHRGHMVHKNYDDTPKVRLGIMMEDGDQGVRVTDVFKGTAADEAELMEGDVILKIDDHYIFTGGTLMKVLSDYKEGESITVRYLRKGKEETATGTLTLRD